MLLQGLPELANCAAHLSDVPGQGLSTWNLKSLPHHQCTMLAHFLRICAKTMLVVFWKLPHFKTGVRQPHGNFCTWLFIRGQLCLILYTTWADRSILSQLRLAFWLDTMSSGSSARYHLAAVPDMALLTLLWREINHQKQNWAHTHRKAGLCIASFRSCGTYLVFYGSLIIPLQVHELATLHLSVPFTTPLEQFWQGTK